VNCGSGIVLGTLNGLPASVGPLALIRTFSGVLPPTTNPAVKTAPEATCSKQDILTSRGEVDVYELELVASYISAKTLPVALDLPAACAVYAPVGTFNNKAASRLDVELRANAPVAESAAVMVAIFADVFPQLWICHDRWDTKGA